MFGAITRLVRILAPLGAVAVLFGATPAFDQGVTGPVGTAQPAVQAGRWEIEVHAGGMFAGRLKGGAAAGSLPVGSPIAVVFGGPTRAVSSWYFGDGAALVNDSFAASPPAFGWTARIAPLDSVLTGLSVRSVSGGSWGVRVSRRLTRRLVIDFDIDIGPTSLALLATTDAQVEATRASYESVWRQFTALGGNSSVAVTSTIATSSSRQVFLSGSLVYSLRAFGKVTPHLTAGLALCDAKPLRVTLIGNTQVTHGGRPYDETDAVKIGFTPVGHRGAGLVGGGMKYALTARTGIRVEMSIALGGPRFDTLLSATPDVKTLTPADVMATGRTPNLQFSNNPSTGFQSSLSGPPIVNLKTFAGAGVRVHTGLTAGLFVRF